MRHILREKDIQRISKKQREEIARRELFESKIEVFMKCDEKDMTYAILFPYYPRASHKSWSLGYYLAYPDAVLERDGTCTNMFPGPSFRKYRHFKKFLKTAGVIRPIKDFELAILKNIPQFNGHFCVTDVEELEPMSEETLQWLEDELKEMTDYMNGGKYGHF